MSFVTPAGEVARPPRADSPSLGNGAIAWSPDGRMLAGFSDPGGAPASVWLMPLDGAARRLAELSTERRPRGITWALDGKHVIIGLVERSADIVWFDQGR